MLENGNRSYTYTQAGDDVVYACLEGYTFVNVTVETTVCLGTGEWDRRPDKCIGKLLKTGRVRFNTNIATTSAVIISNIIDVAPAITKWGNTPEKRVQTWRHTTIKTMKSDNQNQV